MNDDPRQRYDSALDFAAASFVVDDLGIRSRDTIDRLKARILAVRDGELERLRHIVADYENTITWDTTCREHARLLDECRRQEERAEQAEAANALTRERLDALIVAGFGAVGDTLRDLRRILDGEQVEASPWAPIPVPRWAIEALTGPSTIQERGKAERALATALAALDVHEGGHDCDPPDDPAHDSPREWACPTCKAAWDRIEHSEDEGEIYETWYEKRGEDPRG